MVESPTVVTRDDQKKLDATPFFLHTRWGELIQFVVLPHGLLSFRQIICFKTRGIVTDLKNDNFCICIG